MTRITLALLTAAALALLMAGCARQLPQDTGNLPTTGVTTEQPPDQPAGEGW